MTGDTRLTVVGGLAALASIVPLLELTIETDWLLHAGVAVVLVVGAGHLVRRLRAPALVAPLAQLAVVTWWLGILIAGDLAWFGVLPTTEWPGRFEAVFRNGYEAINTLSTPVPVTDGILVYLVSGAAAVAVLVDLVTAGLRHAVLAGIPLAACYTVTASILGGDIGWWWFVPPAVGFLTILVTESRARVSAWGRSISASARRSGVPETDALSRNGRRVGAVALVAAVTVPALAPVLSEGLMDGRGSGGGGGDGRTIRTDNPILDLQRNLNRPDNVDVLRYTAADDAPHYIRSVTLDSFDGEVWQTSDRPVPESQRVGNGLPAPPGMNLEDPPEVELQFEITDNYSSRWLPLVYPAQEIDIDGDWRYDAATLDVVATDDDVLGTDYTAVSLNISTDAATLRDAAESNSEVNDLTELPDELPPIVTDLADEVTKEATTDFGRAAALQEWFRGPDFTYDITRQPGTSASALADFLNDRTGYCEQFAATMAVMARHLGIPARVAVGFTPGTFEGEGTWLVRAHDSHAWPELYFEGVGWVRFEPTPASRTGTAPSWTLRPNQSTPDDNAPVPESTRTSSPSENENILPEEQFPGGTGGTPTDTASSWPWIAGASVAGAALLACVPFGLATARRWRRWQRAGHDPMATAAASWSDLSEAVRDAGLPWDAAATPRTIGRSVAANAELDGDLRELLDHIVTTTERARYSRSSQPVPELREDTAMLCRTLLRSQGPWRRVRAFLWPTALQDACVTTTRAVGARLERVDAAGTRLGMRARMSMTRAARAAARR